MLRSRSGRCDFGIIGIGGVEFFGFVVEFTVRTVEFVVRVVDFGIGYRRLGFGRVVRGIVVLGDLLVGRWGHPVLRIIAVGKLSLHSGRPVIRIAVVSGGRATLGAPLGTSAVQYAGRQRRVGRLPDPGVPVGEDREQHEDPEHDQADP